MAIISLAQQNNVVIPEDQKMTRLLFILDASGSMQNLWDGKPRMNIAKEILLEIAQKFEGNPKVKVGLRVYGHQYPDNCQDSKLEVGFSSSSLSYIERKLGEVRPRGTTPISYALEKSAGDFPKDANSRNIVILITDGLESCNQDPCAVSLALQKKNIFLKPFIIGLGLGIEGEEAFKCMGTFYNVTNAATFKSVFKAIVDRTLSNTTVKVDLLDIYKKPTETDVNMTFYDAFSKTSKYNYYHTFDFKGQSDRLSIDPVLDYNLTIHTTPPVINNKLKIKAGEDNVIKVDAPQGYLKLKFATVNQNIDDKVKSLIRRSGNAKTVDVLDMNIEKKYLVGKYEVEFLTLPRIILKNVSIDQNKTTTLQVPPPGLLTVLKNYIIGSIFVKQGNKLEEIYQMNESATRETIALQPGKYKIIARAKYAKTAEATIEKEFEIKSGSSLSIKL